VKHFFDQKEGMMNENLQIEKYIEELKKWNRSINLVQKDTLDNIWNRHIEDSLTLIDLLNKGDRIIDIGSGAGFPGIPLVIHGFKNITLCENNYKKSTFLRHIRSFLKLDYNIFEDDIFNYTGEIDAAISRAFGSIKNLINVMTRVRIPIGLFHKGVLYRKEIEEAMDCFSFDFEIFEFPNKNGVIVGISNARMK
jgi:16S rRNA (guanine527-N7)-methyltransferase